MLLFRSLYLFWKPWWLGVLYRRFPIYVRSQRMGPFLLGWNWSFQGMGSGPVPLSDFFWSSAWCGFVHAYEDAALEAIRFLQGLYGFVVRVYNYDCMMAYRSSLRSSMTVAVSAVWYVGRLERELLRLRHASTNVEISPDVVFFCPNLIGLYCTRICCPLSVFFSSLLLAVYSCLCACFVLCGLIPLMQ